jgi:hypothetical protein
MTRDCGLDSLGSYEHGNEPVDPIKYIKFFFNSRSTSKLHLFAEVKAYFVTFVFYICPTVSRSFNRICEGHFECPAILLKFM